MEAMDARAEHERGLTAFLERDQARRVAALLASARGRAKVIGMLAHSLRFVPERGLKVPPGRQTPEGILALLKQAGAGSTCYVISEQTELDGSLMPVADALDRVVGHGYGTFLSCLPGKLGYYEAEDQDERYLLRSPR